MGTKEELYATFAEAIELNEECCAAGDEAMTFAGVPLVAKVLMGIAIKKALALGCENMSMIKEALAKAVNGLVKNEALAALILDLVEAALDNVCTAS